MINSVHLLNIYHVLKPFTNSSQSCLPDTTDIIITIIISIII